MSNFPENGSQRFGKALEKSNFTQTCNLLSQFLKEKRSSGNFSLGMAGKIESRAGTKDLLTSKKNPDDALRHNALAMENLPQYVENACIKRSDSRSQESSSPQLTIIYSGKVLVFDAFPAEKATEVMELATKLSSDSTTSGINKIPQSASVAADNQNVLRVPQTNTAQEVPRPGPQAGNSGPDMRYPRRSSLVKFFEKRKERVTARGPYQLNNPKHEGSSSGNERDHQCPKHLDLNL